MINFKKFDVEYIASLIFGSIGFILSIFIGFIAGNAVALIIVRSFIVSVVFSIIGFTCLIIVKKFVPEIYQILNTIDNNKNINIKKDDSDNFEVEETENFPDDSAVDINSEPDQKGTDMELENEFNTFEKEPGEDSYVSTDRSDTNIISKNISSEKKIRYEPKIAAQAVRTMMKRDE